MRLHFGPCHKPTSTSRHSRRDSRVATEISALRRFRCALCGVLALVCRFCDRGQISTCARVLSDRMRRESLAPRLLSDHRSDPSGPPAPSVLATVAVTGALRSSNPRRFRRFPMSVSVSLSFRHPFTDHRPPSSSTPIPPPRPPLPLHAFGAALLSTEGNYFCDFCGVSPSRFLRRNPIVICRRRGIPRRPP